MGRPSLWKDVTWIDRLTDGGSSFNPLCHDNTYIFRWLQSISMFVFVVMKWESAWFLCVEKANVFYSDIINGCENEIDVYICVYILKNRTLALLLTSVWKCVISISWILIALWILFDFTLIRLGQTFWQQSTSDSSL